MTTPDLIPTEHRSAAFSPCRKYRYALHVIWDSSLLICNFIGLNPSTADEFKDDPTIRRCKGYCRSWGYGGLIMTNLFAFRATDPKAMMQAEDPVGPENDGYLATIAVASFLRIAAWGNLGSFKGRGAHMATVLPELMCLGVSKEGYPKHPLYLRADLKPIPFLMPQEGAFK